MNSGTSTSMVNSEMPTAGILAVIITIPSLFALILVVALTTTIIVLVIKRNNRGTRAESYYSTVGPPLPPIKIDKNMSNEGRLEPWRIANTEVDYDDRSLQPVDKICDNSTSDSDTSSVHHQHSVPVTVTTTENTAYGTNIATAPEIRAEENVAYNYEISADPSGPRHSQSSREDAPEMIPNPAYATNVSIAPEIGTQTNVAYVRY